MPKDDELRDINIYLSKLERNLEEEVLIGCKGKDEVLFNTLRDLINSKLYDDEKEIYKQRIKNQGKFNNRRYNKVKEEKITYPQDKDQYVSKGQSYNKLYDKLERELYDIIIEKAVRIGASIVTLHDKQKNGRLEITAYYFKENKWNQKK